MGRFCILCGTTRPNEAFGGKGERARICRKCRKLPREKQEALKQQYEIFGFMEQSRISDKNVARLRTLARSENPRIAGLATVVLEVAQVRPYKCRRLRILARERRELLNRMEETGLILARPAWEDTHSDQTDPAGAWIEWEEFANVHE
jgi:hypothetical protein